MLQEFLKPSIAVNTFQLGSSLARTKFSFLANEWAQTVNQISQASLLARENLVREQFPETDNERGVMFLTYQC